MTRMVVSDMDGTLLNKKAEISAGNIEAIRRLEENHVEFVIASGRDLQGVRTVVGRYGIECEAILGNGSQYVDRQGNLLMSCYMKKNIVHAVVQIFQDMRIPHMIFATDGFFTADEPEAVRDAFMERSGRRFGRSAKEFDKGGTYEYLPCNQLQKVEDIDRFLHNSREIMKVEAFVVSCGLENSGERQVGYGAGCEELSGAEAISRAKEQLKKIPGISFLSSFEDNVEVTDQDAQKGYILDKVIRLKGLSREDVAVVGDGMNDLSMFELFPDSYAPSNAQPTIREMAGEIVSSNDEDGFARAVDRIMEKNLTVTL